MKKNISGIFSRLWAVLCVCICLQAAQAAVPSAWLTPIQTYQYNMPVMARVHSNGSALKLTGSKVAVFYQGELRGVADYDNADGYYFYNLAVGVAATTEGGYTFQFYHPTEDKVYDLELPASLSPLPFKDTGYGNFNEQFEFEPLVLTLPAPVANPTVKVTLTPSTAKWKLDSGSWQTSGATVTTTVGDHIISYQAPTGYIPPNPTKITLKAGEAFEKGVALGYIPPEVTVTLTPSTAKWKLDDGAWNASGATVITKKGDHIISYQDVEGYVTPASTVITLMAGDEYTKSTAYVPVSPTVKVTLTPSTAKWKLDSGAWQNSGATVTTTVGSHTISYQAVTGYTTPSNDTITLVAGQAFTKSVAYTAAYSVTVTNGTASPAKASAGQTVTITANAPAEGKVFSKWTTTSGVTFANANAETTTFTMPAKAVSVTAVYVTVPAYAVSVTGGWADKTSARSGETVTVHGDLIVESGDWMPFKRFVGWEATGVQLADATAPSVTFTMPGNAVALSAKYVGMHAIPPMDWYAVPSDANSMTVIGKVRLPNGACMKDDDSLVGCFDEAGVCRGLGAAVTVSGETVYVLLVSGVADGEELSLALWSNLTDEKLAIVETLVFQAGACAGSLESPLDWTTLYYLNDASNPESPYYSPELFGEDPVGTVFSMVVSAAWDNSVIGYDYKLRLHNDARPERDSLDCTMPPRTPPFAFDEYATFTSADGVSLMLDSRPEDSPETSWTMTVTVPSGKPAVIGWDAETIPEGWAGTAEVISESNAKAAEVNLLEEESLTIQNAGTWRVVFMFRAGAAEDSMSYRLKPGWNLITTTLNLDDASLNKLMAQVPMRLNTDTNSYSVVSAADIKPGVALWIWCEASVELTLSGTEVRRWEFAPAAGWNFVGAVKDVPAEQWPEGVTDVWCWTAAGYRRVTDTLKAGTAYWVFSN